MDREFRRKFVEYANTLPLKERRLPILRRDPPTAMYSDLIEMVEHQLILSDQERRLVLPNLKAFSNSSLGVFSDYSGEGSGSYFVYSVLVCGFNMRAGFDLLMKDARERHRLGEKEIAFKDFRMGQMRRALPDFLHAADQLPGFLCTVAVDKAIVSVLGAHDRENKEKMIGLLEQAGLGRRKAAVAEKIGRVTHLTAYLIALLGSTGQNIFWMTDHDEICGPSDQHELLLRLLFERVLPIYVRRGVEFDKMGGAIPFPEKSVEMNDLLSIPDVAAGTLGDYLSKWDVQRPDEIRVKEGAEKVLLWLGRDGVGLKKVCFILRMGNAGVLERGEVRMSPTQKEEMISSRSFSEWPGGTVGKRSG